MSKKQFTLVYYHVPQDKDDPNNPNVFGIPQAKPNIRLHHIYEAFPLKGSYLFRFKCSYEGVTVWLDLPSIEAKIPFFKEKIYMKATRVSWEDSKIHEYYRYRTVTQTSSKAGEKNQIDFFDISHQPHPTNAKQTNQMSTTANGNLLDDHGSHYNNNNSNNIPWKDNTSHVVKSVQPGIQSGFDLLGGDRKEKKQANLMQHHGDLI